MELTATVVNWNNFKEVVNNGQLMDILFEEIEYEKELIFTQTPWPSDSSVEYINVAEQLRDLTEPSEGIKLIINELINEDFTLPNELEIEVDPELVSGSISPSSAEKYNKVFNQLDMSDLTDSIADYLGQWRCLFKFACENKAGVYFQLG
jgi:hypothetical protein